MSAPQTSIHPDPATLAHAAAERVATLARAAIAEHGSFHWALAGGNTPRALYTALADGPPPWDWGRTHIYFGDERCVPPDDPQSNYRMARESLLDRVPIPPQQIHPILADAAYVRESARAYAHTLAAHLPRSPGGAPQFDLVLLGLGPDGHVASLFPGTCVLHQDHLAVAAVYVDRLHAWRISISLALINQARHVLLLVAGAEKAAMVAEVLGTAPGTARLPVQRLQPQGGLEWFLDRAAAAQLPPQEAR